MATLDLSQAMKSKKTVIFYIARSSAIQQYATLEQSLCQLFSSLLGTAQNLGAIVFFKITAARFRLEIIEKLIKKTGKIEYLEYWKGVQVGCNKLDNTRNNIIHWNISTDLNLTEAGTEVTAVSLIAPNFWDFDMSGAVTLEKLANFASEADFISRSLNIFHSHVFGGLDQGDAWREIFRKPLVYPPQEGHPLCPSPTEHEPQPSSSQGK